VTVRLLAGLLVLVAAAGCATKPPHPEAFSFAVVGDAPYSDREALDFDAMLAAMRAEPLAFVVHVGDFKAGGSSPCTDELYAAAKARLQASPHPLILTPGDNDWTDCRRESNGRMDPLERLARMRETFFGDAWSLGRARLPLARQDECAERSGTACRCPGIPENRLWTKNGVVFATLHVVGSNDNLGFDAANDAEQTCRSAANRAWLERAVRFAEAPGRRGLAVFAHVNPWDAGNPALYAALVAQVAAGAVRLAKPVLFAHGDTHTYRVDRPFRDGRGKAVENARRLETFGSPQVGWVRVTVDPNDAALFRFEPRPPAGPGG
jgi:hypothetical protein